VNNVFKEKGSIYLSMINIKLFFVILMVLLLVIPIILQYIYGWGFFFSLNNKTYNISVYGLYLLSYILIQGVFSILNDISIKGIITNKEKVTNEVEGVPKINIMVVGYKEDPIYYKMCLESIRTCYKNVLNLNKIYIIVDGNDTDDKYMVDMCFQVFNDTKFVHINFDDVNMKEEVLLLDISEVHQNDIICVSKKNNGKRSAMMTGFKFSFLENNLYNNNVGLIFCTDSDTLINNESIMEMSKCFGNNIGAVVGDLGIHNRYDSLIAFMSSVRYWYAFNLERAYQSFTGNVLCVSGPIGMYKMDYLEKIIDDWSNQSFLGNICSYGDDRHLTNKILELGKNVKYVSSAYVETETPSNWYRFFKQQSRWNKSAFREFFWTIKILHKHSLFMTVDLVYMMVYPYVIIGYLMYILWHKTIFEFSFYFSIVLFLGFVKSIYGVVRSGKMENIFYFTYIFIFPCKLWAIININDNSWGTLPRKISSNRTISYDILVPIMWNIILVASILYNIWNSIKGGYVYNDFLLFIVVTSISFISILASWFYVSIKRRNNVNKIQVDLKIE
jgi:hyaluronan synthase